MEAKIHKDVVLFKRILTHDKFDDHVEEVGSDCKDYCSRLLRPQRLTRALACRFISQTSSVSLVSKLEQPRAPAARQMSHMYISLLRICTLCQAAVMLVLRSTAPCQTVVRGLCGLRSVSLWKHCNTKLQFQSLSTCHLLLQPVFTKKLLLRGQYQTLPLAVYGWAMPVETGVKVTSWVACCQYSVYMPVSILTANTDRHCLPSVHVLPVSKTLQDSIQLTAMSVAMCRTWQS